MQQYRMRRPAMESYDCVGPLDGSGRTAMGAAERAIIDMFGL